MSVLSSTDLPTIEVDLGPAKIEDEKKEGPSFHCDLYDTEVVHKLALMFLPELATACVDSTTGGIFRTPGSVAVDLRKEMIDYLTQRSETFVAESVILEGGPEGEVSDHPFDIISNFVDDFVSSKRNFFSRVSGWLLSEKREDNIDDFVQEMEMNGFWPLDRRETIAETLLKNVDFKNSFHCSVKFNSLEELASHVHCCSFRSMICENEGCDARFCAAHLEKHDSACPFKIIPCEQHCSESVMRREMDRHCITVCPMKLVNCPFYSVGCRSAVAQCMIKKHRSENLHSHLFYFLRGRYKEASKEDLERRVDQIIQAASNSRLAEARDVRSLTLTVKNVEAKLGPIEITPKQKPGADDNAKNEESEDSDIKRKEGEQGAQTSNMENSSDKAEVSSTVDKDSAENKARNNDSEIKEKSSEQSTQTTNAMNNEGDIKEQSSEQSTQTSSIISSSDGAEVNTIMNKDGAENNDKNEDIESSHIENKGSEASTQIPNLAKSSDEAGVSSVNNSAENRTEISSHKADVNATDKDIEEHNLKNKDMEDYYFKDKDNEVSIETSKMENQVPDEHNVKNKDIEDYSFKDADNEVSIEISKMENQGSEEHNVKNKDIEDINLEVKNSKESIQTSDKVEA